jgi:hypothetical protein
MYYKLWCFSASAHPMQECSSILWLSQDLLYNTVERFPHFIFLNENSPLVVTLQRHAKPQLKHHF